MTVTGVGGVGKTRLALQVAADVLPHYRDGAWLVELASVRDVAGVVGAVAEMFRFTGRSGQSLEDSLLEMLAQKQTLLVVDNCEHVLGSVARLVSAIERKCPGIVVLATSREGLAIDGEQMLALPPLEAGQPGEDIERLIHADAISLFVERARQVKADFALNDNNSRAVVDICQRLDGVPLAIELAAARVMALSPAELLRRLDRRFQVLSGGRRSAIERHATLRAAIDWSYDLLDSAEQRLLARLAVFSGGCTLEAIEEVCSGDPVERDAVMDLVAGLVARSLVVAEDSDLGTRYRMLETIRQYGEERLADSGETDAVLLRHAAFYAQFSARAAEKTYGPDQLVWARQIKLERDNFSLPWRMPSIPATLQWPLSWWRAIPPIEGRGTNRRTTRRTDVRRTRHARSIRTAGISLRVWWWQHKAQSIGDWQRVDELCQQALEAEERLGAFHGPRIEMETCSLQAQNSLAAGAYADAVSAYARAAELANGDGYSGLAAIFLAYKVSCALLGGAAAREMEPTVEESALGATLRDARGDCHQPQLPGDDARRRRSRSGQSPSRREHRTRHPGRGKSVGSPHRLPGRRAARGLGPDVALVARSMDLERWVTAPMDAAPCLALCARALAEDRPEVGRCLAWCGLRHLQTRRRRSRQQATIRRRHLSARTPTSFWRRCARAGDIVTAALGDERRTRTADRRRGDDVWTRRSPTHWPTSTRSS